MNAAGPGGTVPGMTTARRQATPFLGPFLGPLPRAADAPAEHGAPGHAPPVRLLQAVLSALVGAAALLMLTTGPGAAPLTFHDPAPVHLAR